MSGEKRSGADELRLIVCNMDCSREGFLDQFTAEQLVTLYRAHLACGWDFLPDSWTPRQVREALRGIVPMWDDDERPYYAKADARDHVHVARCRTNKGEPYEADS